MNDVNELTNAAKQSQSTSGNEHVTDGPSSLPPSSITSPAQEPASFDEAKRVQCTPKPVSRRWLSLPFLTLLAIIFYAQGRAFTESYLNYFGLNSSQFPVSPDDAYWYAFMAWGLIAGKGPNAILRAYPAYLLAEWIPLVVTVALPLTALIGHRYGWAPHLKMRFGKTLAWFNPKHMSTDPSKGIVKQFALGGLPSLLMASVPLMLLALTFILALMIVVFVLPFWNLGQWQARADCATDVSSHQVVHYADEPVKSKNGEPLSPSRLLQCGPEFCAVIRDGRSYVIPKTAIRLVDGLSIGRATTSHLVPKDQQLCTRPKAMIGTEKGTGS